MELSILLVPIQIQEGVYWFRLAEFSPPVAGQAPTCKTSKKKLTAKKEDDFVLDEAEFALAA